MREVLSSRLTFWYKVILPGIWGGGGLAGLTKLLYQGGSGQESLFFLTWIVGLILFLRINLPLKKVYLEGQTLIVSNYLRECVIPLSEIQMIVPLTGYGNFPRHRVRCKLATPTLFGQELTFALKGALIGNERLQHILKARL